MLNDPSYILEIKEAHQDAVRAHFYERIHQMLQQSDWGVIEMRLGFNFLIEAYIFAEETKDVTASRKWFLTFGCEKKNLKILKVLMTLSSRLDGSSIIQERKTTGKKGNLRFYSDYLWTYCGTTDSNGAADVYFELSSIVANITGLGIEPKGPVGAFDKATNTLLPPIVSTPVQLSSLGTTESVSKILNLSLDSKESSSNQTTSPLEEYRSGQMQVFEEYREQIGYMLSTGMVRHFEESTEGLELQFVLGNSGISTIDFNINEAGLGPETLEIHFEFTLNNNLNFKAINAINALPQLLEKFDCPGTIICMPTEIEYTRGSIHTNGYPKKLQIRFSYLSKRNEKEKLSNFMIVLSAILHGNGYSIERMPHFKKTKDNANGEIDAVWKQCIPEPQKKRI